MRVPVPFRREPTTLEKLLGKRRARMLRRRLGLASMGMGLSLLKPRRETMLAVSTVALATTTLLFATRM